MYSMTTRVRYSEADCNGKLTETSLLNYLQDCAIFHSEDVNYGIEYMRANNVAWVLGSWQIDIEDMPNIGDNIEIQTYPYYFKRFVGCRGYIVRSEDGTKEYARANSVWSYIKLDTMKPGAVPDGMVEAYGLDEKPEMDYSSSKLKPPEGVDGIVKPSITIMSNHIDTNNHVNNGQYVLFAADYIGSVYSGEVRIRRIKAEYKKQVFEGDILIPVIYVYDNAMLVTFQAEDKNISAGVEFCFA